MHYIRLWKLNYTIFAYEAHSYEQAHWKYFEYFARCLIYDFELSKWGERRFCIIFDTLLKAPNVPSDNIANF